MAQRLSDAVTAQTDLLLAIESATPQASVALLRGEDVVAERSGEGGDPHAERLLPMVDELLAAADAKLDEVGAFAISIGPGGFTSLRIGLATLKGLAFGRDARVAAVSTLHALAFAAFEAGRVERGETCVALLDARRGEVYAGAYRHAADAPDAPAALEAVIEDGVHTAEALGAALATGPSAGLCLVGEGAALFGDAIVAAAAPGQARVDAGRPVLPTARGVGRIGREVLAAGRGEHPAALVPRYLRRSQAEEERAARGPG